MWLALHPPLLTCQLTPVHLLISWALSCQLLALLYHPVSSRLLPLYRTRCLTPIPPSGQTPGYELVCQDCMVELHLGCTEELQIALHLDFPNC